MLKEDFLVIHLWINEAMKRLTAKRLGRRYIS